MTTPSERVFILGEYELSMHYERLEMDGWPEKKIKMTFTSIFVAHHNNNFHICDLGKEAPKTNNQPLHFIHS